MEEKSHLCCYAREEAPAFESGSSVMEFGVEKIMWLARVVFWGGGGVCLVPQLL